MSIAKDLLNELTDKIYNNTIYPATKLESSAQVSDIITSYMFVAEKLSKDKNSNLYYKGDDGERQKFLSNPFISGVYNMIYTGSPNYILRDQIWTIESLIMYFAGKDPRFLPIHQPYKYGEALNITPDANKINPPVQDTRPGSSLSPGGMFDSIKKFAPFILIGAGVLFFLMKKGKK